jgi:Bacterial regulatory proteins, luxR family
MAQACAPVKWTFLRVDGCLKRSVCEPPVPPQPAPEQHEAGSGSAKSGPQSGHPRTALRDGPLSNRLHLSERTVENHVANILGKLGFDSRAKVAAWHSGRGVTR